VEWVIALIVVVIVPFGIVLWLIPHYDAIGVQKAKDRIAREPAATFGSLWPKVINLRAAAVSRRSPLQGKKGPEKRGPRHWWEAHLSRRVSFSSPRAFRTLPLN
jgi:hypothetical protein